MKKLFVLPLFFFLLYAASDSSAQDFKTPEHGEFESAEDYRLFEGEILKAVDFLENTSLDEEKDKRKEAAIFVLKWLEGSPDLIMNIRPYMVEINKKNKDFLLIFMGGYARYAIENHYAVNEFNAALSGLKSVFKVYKNGKGVSKDSVVEELIEKDEDGKLEAWLQEKLQDGK